MYQQDIIENEINWILENEVKSFVRTELLSSDKLTPTQKIEAIEILESKPLNNVMLESYVSNIESNDPTILKEISENKKTWLKYAGATLGGGIIGIMFLQLYRKLISRQKECNKLRRNEALFLNCRIKLNMKAISESNSMKSKCNKIESCLAKIEKNIDKYKDQIESDKDKLRNLS